MSEGKISIPAKEIDKGIMYRLIMGALKSTEHDHGKDLSNYKSSATKRILGAVLGYLTHEQP